MEECPFGGEPQADSSVCLIPADSGEVQPLGSNENPLPSGEAIVAIILLSLVIVLAVLANGMPRR